MTKLTAYLVGSHFRPPAKQLLMHLPQGAALELRPEPENPYDEGAIAVYCVPQAVLPPAQRELCEQTLEGTGVSLEELLDMAELHLGYVAKSGGKTAGGLPGNLEFAQQGMASGPAKLMFSPEGKTMVEAQGSEEQDHTRDHE